jgi:spore coat protein A
MRAAEVKLHRDLPVTRVWTYGGSSPGPTFETRSGQGLLIEWANELPARHFLPIDPTLHGAEASQPEVRAVVHVHGAKVPPGSDGYPEAWYVPGKSATYYYPNHQEATMLWYHDHTMGITRLNTYAGLFGVFFIRDAVEDALNLPKGPYEIPLVICDRLLRQNGDLDYPDSGVKDNPWVPEVFGNAFLVNGKLSPYLEVEARAYRFRVLNCSNGRFLQLSLSDRQMFHQIGSDQGLLAAPVALNVTHVAPGERVDLVIDFSGHGGEKMILNNGSFDLMQFRVKPAAVGAGVAAAGSRLPESLRQVSRIPESSAVRTRQLALIEHENLVGESMKMLLNDTHWDMPVTENPVIDTVEIWSLLNTTDDSHPIHLHLVRFQILDRRKFDVFAYFTQKKVRYTGPAVPPEAFEAGWKDTVRADPKMVTRIIVRFEGYTGRYVWHCHVLEHEDNEMMRPYDVLPAAH